MYRKGNKMNKKILTFDDLLRFCKEQDFKSFDSSESGYKLAVKVPITFEEIKSDDAHRGMMKLKFKLFHTLLNRNGSFVPDESADKAMLTIPDRPILAAIHQLDDGTWDFEAHEIEEIENEKGEREIVYIERQVGSFSSEPAWKEYDEDMDKTYICCYGYIPIEYTKTAEIIERKQGTKNSVELCIEKMSYDVKENYLVLEDFYVNGSTLLGSEDDGTEIGEGMLGSRADIVDFSEENNSVKFETSDKLVKVLEKLNTTLSNLNINNSCGKEEEEVKKAKQVSFEEMTQENINEEVKNAEPTNEEPANEPTVEEPVSEEVAPIVTEDLNDTAGDPEPDSEPEPVVDADPSNKLDPSGDPTGDDEPTINPAINDDGAEEGQEIVGIKKVQYKVEFNDKVREFSIGLTAKLDAMSMLIDATYGDADNEWYCIEMFEEEKYVEMYGMFSGKCYRQSYEENNGEYSLTGERIEIFHTFVTAEQKEQLEAQKTQFAEMSEKLRHYEEEPDKMAILNSNEYSKVFDTKEYQDFMKQDAHFELEIDEVKAKADAILLDYAKHSNFSVVSNSNDIRFVGIPRETKKVGRYGTLFATNSETEA